MSMLFKVEGRWISVMAEQSRKALEPMMVTPSGRVKLVILEHWPKANVPTYCRVVGNSTLSTLRPTLKA